MASETRPLLGTTTSASADDRTSGRSSNKTFSFAIVIGAIMLAGGFIAVLMNEHKLPNYLITSLKNKQKTPNDLPNIIVFMIDDLGFNQVGYHANPEGNDEVHTPNIDDYSAEGIRMERGYMTPWCAPSRSAFQTGSMNSFNGEATNDVYAFDDDIGFIGGLQAGTVTLAMALKKYATSEGKKPYKTSYAGKWGIGGTAWANTPMALGYDSFQGFWGDSMDSCDGWIPLTSVPGMDGDTMRAVPGYWKQSKDVTNEYCENFKELKSDGTLTQDEVDVACNSVPIDLPKIMDDDILDYTIKILNEHDFDEGPLYHMHATQILHLPMQYPSSYDEDEKSELKDLKGKVKPTSNNTILRWKTNNMLRWMDDIFGKVMATVKDRNQWDNTIVLFTTDNGGAIYMNSANNNFPLRGSKLSAFEGGIRVPQFLAGGWLKQQNPNIGSHPMTSNTFVIANDWAPTLLGMAGGDKSYLLGDAEGPAYGNNLWDNIQASVTSETGHQMERTVTFSPQLFLDIREDATYKYIQTLDHVPIYFARHWNAIWPTDDDIIPDFGYRHVNPCRPNGESMECCYFRVDEDEHENNPLPTDCEEKRVFANESYYASPTCDVWPKQLCSEPDHNDIVPSEKDQGWYSLWTLYNASGPFTNSSGYPITAEKLLGSMSATKCACSVIDENTKKEDVNAFIPLPTSPAICIDSSDPYYSSNEFYLSCDGFSRPTFEGNYVDSYVEQGFPRDLIEKRFKADKTSVLDRLLHTPMILELYHAYVTRKNFTEWPNWAKFPYVAAGQDSCASKNITVNPISELQLTLWFPREGDVTAAVKAKDNLCIVYAPGTYFCPAVDNAKQEKIISFNYSELNPSFTISTEAGEKRLIEAKGYSHCKQYCSPEDTAYIGEGKWGITTNSA